jgi:hypothetical protein
MNNLKLAEELLKIAKDLTAKKDLYWLAKQVKVGHYPSDDSEQGDWAGEVQLQVMEIWNQLNKKERDGIEKELMVEGKPLKIVLNGVLNAVINTLT